ncbi:NAD(P)H-dependent oxidoreductase [Roseobacter ponti]|uniref:NAD(P)H-dependent oxidoreductase n=1 Tax=Roseobacter ponti TaxID=1891787 RepID=A0A858SV69_9RHOB|nr:NAD(P)H-dependent oxidoreductase [Roseobacter ponti]QJF52585.1 NAD(P)H-dependent oxidoreductase [Roseobacter ponti]
MNVLIVHAHPESKSFNGAMTAVAHRTLSTQGHTVTVSDLYRDGFKAVSDRGNFTGEVDPEFLKLQAEERFAAHNNGFSDELEQEISRLEAADLVIFQFPLWWFGFPAIMKGWVDRTFAAGRIYGGSPPYEGGRFRGRRALLSLTTGAPAEVYEADGMHGDLMGILRPIHRGILSFVGYDVLAPQVLCGAARVGEKAREDALEAWADRLTGIMNEAPIEIGRY